MFFCSIATLYCTISVVTSRDSMVSKSDIGTMCGRGVQLFSYDMQCKNCQVKHHLACTNKNRDKTNSDMWHCPCWMYNIFVYNHIDDDDDFHCAILEGVFDCAFRLQEMNSNLYPFEINERLNAPFWGYGARHAILNWYDLYWKYAMSSLFRRYLQPENKRYRNKQTVIFPSKVYQSISMTLNCIYTLKLYTHKVFIHWTHWNLVGYKNIWSPSIFVY